MVDIREYLRKKEKNEKKDSKDFKREIRAHRLKVILRSGCVIGVIAALTVTAVTLLKKSNLLRLHGRVRNRQEPGVRFYSAELPEWLSDLQ